jgi:hypothetical protein
MAYTFEQCWRKVLLYAPEVPVFLAREFVQQAFGRLAESRPWAWKRKEVHLTTLASRTLAITFTAGSTAITSAAGFVASDAGRQIRVPGAPIPLYTINTFTDASTAVLLEPYRGSSGAADVTILDAYLVCPEDFGSFLTIADPQNQRQIPFWITEDVLNGMDPHRSTSGDAGRLLVSKEYSRATPTLGRLLYEWWPHPSAARTYPALYLKRPQTLLDTDILPGVLSQRGDVLITGALAECAAWPGTAARPNPYFNLQTHQLKKRQFEQDLLALQLRDDDQFPMDYPTLPWHEMAAWQMAYDTNLLRSSDATLASYY